MTASEIQMLKDFFTRELDGFKATAAAARAESRDDHKIVTESIAAVDEKVDDVRQRVTKLEANDELRLKKLTKIQYWIGTLIAGVPVLFFLLDRITH